MNSRTGSFLACMTVLFAVTVLAGCASERRRGATPTVTRLVDTPAQTPAASQPADPNSPVSSVASRPAPASEPLIDWSAEEGPLDLSVEEAAISALLHNEDLSVQELNPVITGTFEQIERGVYDPEFFLEAVLLSERTSETSRSTGEQFSVEGRDTGLSTGLRQSLPTGTDLELSVDQDRTMSDRAPEQQTARLGLTVTQQLLQGFGPQVNLASIRQAEMETIASEYELRGFTEALLADAEIAYWNYVLAQEQIAIFERSLEVARQQRDQVEQRIEVGTLAETQAAAARAEVASQEQALIDARSALNERRLRLLRLMNPDPEGELDWEIVAVSNPTIDPEPIEDLEQRMELAEEFRPELNEARMRMKQARLETIVTRNGLLPRLEFFVNLGKTGFDDTFGGSFRRLTAETYDVMAGVRFSHLLGNRAARARDLAARTSLDQAVRSVENLRQLVRFEVRLAANEVNRAGQQIAATTATRVLQEQTLEAEQQRFDVGTSIALLVAQAQRDLLVSQIAEVEATINYRIALVRLYLAEGSLLQRRGIRTEADPRLPSS